MAGELRTVDHPLVQHKLTLMRDRTTPSKDFRRLLKEVSLLLAYEATRDLATTLRSIETPLERMEAPVLAGKKLAIISVLRAGNGILDGMLELLPSARVGHVGLYRNEDTLEAVRYYLNLPGKMTERGAIVVDPMLATGHSAVAAVKLVRESSPAWIRFVSLVAAPEGIATFHQHHPDVAIITA
ncbi:MAG: uracil phosphoribosyltransferase, partial [Thermoanaerobaculia bacterium]|nr:uracil phosphoribosyltransferase [Thermoanaerobaculia bacterium]